MPKISICIPTYKRSDLLKVAIESCLAQTCQDFEIVVVDDSPDLQSEAMIANLSPKTPIVYVHNGQKTSQAKAVNQLLSRARGEFLVLLHDDNFLMPTALDQLRKPLEDNPSVVAAFGKDYLAQDDGLILHRESELLNQHFWKTNDRANIPQRSSWSILVGQFPGDGYMVRTDAARKTLYRLDSSVGEACDADFGYRLADLGEFFFVGEYTHVYRATSESISASGLPIHLSKMYFMVESLKVPSDLEHLRRSRLRQLAPAAINGCLLTGERGHARKILVSGNYPWRQQLAKGSVQLLLAFAPRAATEMVITRNSRRRHLATGGWLHFTPRAGEV